MVVSVENINKAIDKTCEFLISKQREDGSWSYDDILPGEPMIYHKPLMHTSEAIQTLIFSKNHKFIPNIMRGIHFCSNVELSRPGLCPTPGLVCSGRFRARPAPA